MIEFQISITPAIRTRVGLQIVRSVFLVATYLSLTGYTSGGDPLVLIHLIVPIGNHGLILFTCGHYIPLLLLSYT